MDSREPSRSGPCDVPRERDASDGCGLIGRLQSDKTLRIESKRQHIEPSPDLLTVSELALIVPNEHLT